MITSAKMTDTIQVENLTFGIRRSEKRKTLAITVERDGTLIIHSPIGSTPTQLASFVQEKLFWIFGKLSEKQLYNSEGRKREFVNGESFYYLGRKYRLMLVEDNPSTSPLRLHRGMFELRSDKLEDARDVFIFWYVQHGETWLWNRTQSLSQRLNVPLINVNVGEIGYRWGMFNETGMMKLHWRVILFPPNIIDYILVHELSHYFEPHHNKSYWHIVERLIPDYKNCQHWLARYGARYDL